jgi:multicomponent Na+:H+ antiporter subunit G
MELALDIVSAVLLAAGAFFVFVGGLGVMRMPDFYTRMHAASLTDTGGAALVIAGLLVQGGFTLASAKLLAIFLFLFLTSPTASYALANAALLSGLKPQCRNETGEALPDGTPPLMKKQPAPARPVEAKPAARKAAAKKMGATKQAAGKKASRKTSTRKRTASKKQGKSS